MDHTHLINTYKKQGRLTLSDEHKNTLTLLSPQNWTTDMGTDWVYLLFDLFQIRTICHQFSEVSLDVVEYASKPTIYHSEPNAQNLNGPLTKGCLKFSLIREPNWNKLLFQTSQPVLVQLNSKTNSEATTDIMFPLFSKNVKEMYLGAEGDIKIITK